MSWSRGHTIVFALLGVGLLCSATAVAVAGYSLSGSPAIETPTRTVTYDGQEYTLDSISRITADGSVTVTADVPSGTSYNLNLRGPDNQLITSEQAADDTEYTFSYFGAGEAGTYAATIQNGGDTVAVYPIVIAGYDVGLTDPESVEQGEEATISATVTERSIERHSSLETVQVVVGNDDVQAQQDMTQAEGNTYTTTISTSDIEAGTYNVYVVVRGDEDVRQRAEILGISDTVELTVNGDSTQTETDDSDDEDDSGGGAAPGGDGPESGSTSTESATGDVTETSDPTTEETESSPDTESTESTETGVETSSGDETERESDNILAPSTPSESETATTSASGPGFTILLAILGVLVTAGVMSRQRD